MKLGGARRLAPAIASLSLASLSLASLCLAGAATAQVQIGGWSVSVDDGAGRRPVKTAILLAPEGASLIAACDAKGVDLLVSYIEPLPKSPGLAVTWRLDGKAARSGRWTEASDRTSLSPGGPEADAALLKQLAQGRTLTISAGGRRASFDLTGVRQIANLIGDCPALPPPTPAPAVAPTTGAAGN